tara:strand:+ start:521 stop:703 length:183 start_codon:yes stop_codon:yes gene_type:complete
MTQFCAAEASYIKGDKHLAADAGGDGKKEIGSYRRSRFCTELAGHAGYRWARHLLYSPTD